MGETMKLYIVETGWDGYLDLITDSLETAIAKRDEDEYSIIREGELNVPGNFDVLEHNYYIITFHTVHGTFATRKDDTSNLSGVRLDVVDYYHWENKIYVSVFVGDVPDAIFKAENKAINLISEWLKEREQKLPEVYDLFRKATGGMAGRPDFIRDDYGRIHRVCI